MTRIGVTINIEGIVQGVGFRPFLYNLAMAHGLKGWVKNRGNAGVQLRLEGEEEAINQFVKDIGVKKPAISRIDSLTVEKTSTLERFQGLSIIESDGSTGASIAVPADIATCDACIADMMGTGPGGKNNKYYMYPFVACANCGPRFTTVADLPYDRHMTTMVDFTLCAKAQEVTCKQEYEDPENRRFHAQAFSCPNCGPNYFLVDHEGHVLSRELDALKQSVKKLRDGHVIAMKGIGGVHLVCDATNDRAVLRLRERKGGRKFKPFAIMVPDITAARKLVHVTEIDELALTSPRRPIILLARKETAAISTHVAPGLNSVGIMLPYMGTHHVLFHFCKNHGLGPLVFTSGNASGIPMAITNEDIVAQVGTLADFFLMHDRRIEQRCDDSVGKTVGNTMLLIRRSRGFVPEYIPTPVDTGEKSIIAVGPELHSAGAILKGNKLFPTQYIGDVVNLETLTYLEAAIGHFRKLLRVQDTGIAAVACDAHPAFHSSAWARELASTMKVSLHPVYHHHAHCAALALDKKLDPAEPRVYITCDGVGYGVDGHAWGGEIFAGPVTSLRRIARLKYVPMPGGDLAVKYPSRMLAAILHGRLSRGEVESILLDRFVDGFKEGKTEVSIVLDQLDRRAGPGGALPLTSSTGRLLDAMSVALGACTEASYEGEPAIRLEGMVPPGSTIDPAAVKQYRDAFSSKDDGQITELDLGGAFPLVLQQTSRYTGPRDKARNALAFQAAVGRYLGDEAVTIARREGIKEVGFTGGVSYNEFIFSGIREAIEAAGMTFLHHDALPPGDGCVAAGQALLAWLDERDKA